MGICQHIPPCFLYFKSLNFSTFPFWDSLYVADPALITYETFADMHTFGKCLSISRKGEKRFNVLESPKMVCSGQLLRRNISL